MASASRRKRAPKVYDVEDGELPDANATKKAAAEEEERENQKKLERKRKKQGFRNIRHQIEFYFSEANLTKDKYMMELLNGNSVNWISLEEFLKFKRVQTWTSKVKDIRRALSHSDILELSPDQACVRRKTPIVPKENADDCIIYVEGLPRTVTIDSVKTIFSQWGSVQYISLPKFGNDRPKGFGFIEFETSQMADSTLKAFGEVGCLMEGTPPRLPGGSKEGLVIPPAPLSFMLHNKTEEEAEAESLLPPDNPACDPEAYKKKAKALEEGEIDVDGEGKENEDGEESDEGEILDKRRRKKRKRKDKKHDEKIAFEAGTLGLKVMSKKEWKKLRNHYMDMQRLNFHRMKQALRNAQIEEEETPRYEADMKTLQPRVGVWPRRDAIPSSVFEEVARRQKEAAGGAGPSGTQVERDISKVNPEDGEIPLESLANPWRKKAKPEKRKNPAGEDKKPGAKRKRLDSQSGPSKRLTQDERLDQEAWRKLPYVPDSIVKIFYDFSAENASDTVKSQIRSVVTPENIEVRRDLEVVYVRCRDKLSAQTLLNSPNFPAAMIISGTEQALYWQHVWDVFKEKRKRRRGKEKLLRRVDQFMGLPGYAKAFSSHSIDSAEASVVAGAASAGNTSVTPDPEVVDISDV